MNKNERRRASKKHRSKNKDRYNRTAAHSARQNTTKLSLSGRLAIKIIAEPPDKRPPKLHNSTKEPHNEQTHARKPMDDEQFDEINIVRGQPQAGGKQDTRRTEVRDQK
ncbi:hypothetical protein [Escherichia coli]|uniref:hypothetical protein n=1 Tax=Escherichia coli TaxID=562 RepID=UPI00050BA3B9